MEKQNVVTRVLCERCCDYQPALLMRIVSQSGVSMPFWFCLTCQRAATKPPKWLSRKVTSAYQVDPDVLPVYGNVTVLYCTRCGGAGAEYHHWAPKEVFDDADNWPGAYLCVKCHHKWHEAMIGYRFGRRDGHTD